MVKHRPMFVRAHARVRLRRVIGLPQADDGIARQGIVTERIRAT